MRSTLIKVLSARHFCKVKVNVMHLSIQTDFVEGCRGFCKTEYIQVPTVYSVRSENLLDIGLSACFKLCQTRLSVPNFFKRACFDLRKNVQDKTMINSSNSDVTSLQTWLIMMIISFDGYTDFQSPSYL